MDKVVKFNKAAGFIYYTIINRQASWMYLSLMIIIKINHTLQQVRGLSTISYCG